MCGYPDWLNDLQGAPISLAIEVLGRECGPRHVVAVGRPCWDTLDALVGVSSVEVVETYNTYKDPSRIYTGWKGNGAAVEYPVTRPSRAVSLHPKICWVNPAPGQWSRTCDLVLLAKEDFPFDEASFGSVGDLVCRTASRVFVLSGDWGDPAPPDGFFTVGLDGGCAGFRAAGRKRKEHHETT